MPKLSAKQIAGIVKLASGANEGGLIGSGIVLLKNPDTDGPIFVAIALVESNGVTDAVGGPNTNGSKDYGLWQINDKAHPDLLRQFKWEDPTDNYHMANSLYHGRGEKFTDWSTYNSGLYATRMAEATAAWAGETDTSAVDKTYVPNSSSPLAAVGDFLSVLTNQSTWVRVGEGLAGALLIIIVVYSWFKKATIGAAAKAVIGKPGVK